MDEVASLLSEVKDGTLPLKQLNIKGKQIKKLESLKQKFLQLVWEESWEIAREKYPDFATEEKLKEKFVSSSVQYSIENYCKKALQ